MSYSHMMDIRLQAQAEAFIMYLEAINDEVTKDMYRDALLTFMDPDYVDYFVNEYYGSKEDDSNK